MIAAVRGRKELVRMVPEKMASVKMELASIGLKGTGS